jgi:CheY-like chemotaxis protein
VSLSILLLDEDTDFRRVLASALIGRGYLVYATERPEEAFAVLQNKPVALAVIDNHLPTMSGQKIVHALHALGRAPHILLTTSLASLQREARIFREMTEKHQVYKILAKPLNLDELLLYIETLAPPPPPTATQIERFADEFLSHSPSAEPTEELDVFHPALEHNYTPSSMQSPYTSMPSAEYLSPTRTPSLAFQQAAPSPHPTPTTQRQAAPSPYHTSPAAVGVVSSVASSTPDAFLQVSEPPSGVLPTLHRFDAPPAVERMAFQRNLQNKLALLLNDAQQAAQHPGEIAPLESAYQAINQLQNDCGALGFRAMTSLLGEAEKVLSYLIEEALQDVAQSHSMILVGGSYTTLQEKIEACLLQANRPLQEQLARRDSAAIPTHRLTLLAIGARQHDTEPISRWCENNQIALLFAEGWEAIEEQLQHSKIDALYLDVSTPRSHDAIPLRQKTAAIQEGVSWLQAIRKRPAFREIPVLFATDQAELHHRMMASQITPSQLLVKPIQEQTWLDAIARLTEHRELRQARLLLLTDDNGFALDVAHTLREDGLFVESLESPLLLLEALEEKQPSLLFVSHAIPGFSGLDLCRALRATPRWNELPIFFLAPALDAPLRAAAYHLDIQALITRDTTQEELLAQTRNHLRRSRHLARQRYRDPLTGCLQRNLFLDYLDKAIAHAQRFHTPLHLCLLQPAAWDKIAEEQSFSARSPILHSLHQTLLQHAPPFSLQGRLDERTLALLLPSLAETQIPPLLQSIQQNFEQIPFPSQGTERFHVKLNTSFISFAEHHQHSAHFLLDAFQSLAAS